MYVEHHTVLWHIDLLLTKVITDIVIVFHALHHHFEADRSRERIHE
jgi:hypothetical protein